MNESIDGSRLHGFAIHPGFDGTRNQSNEGLFSLQIGVEIDERIALDELIASLVLQRYVGPTHHADRFRRYLPHHPEEFLAETEIPGVVAQPQNVWRVLIDGLLKVVDILEDSYINLLAIDLRSKGRDKPDVERECVGGKRQRCVSKIAQEDPEWPYRLMGILV